MILKVIKELQIGSGHPYGENSRGLILLKPGHILVPSEDCSFKLASTPTNSSQWGFMNMSLNPTVILRNPECFCSLSDEELKKLKPHFSKSLLKFLGLKKESVIDTKVINEIDKELRFRDEKRHSLSVTLATARYNNLQWFDTVINKHIK